MARVNIIVFTITVLWISNSVTDSVQQDSNHVKKHDGYIDVVVSEDLAAHDNGLSHSDDAVNNLIDSRRARWRLGQSDGPKKLSVAGWIARVAQLVIPELLGRNLEPMTMYANDYDDKKFSKYYGTPLKRGFGRGKGVWKGLWNIGDYLLPYPDSTEMLSAMKTLKKKHSMGSLPNAFYD